MSAIIYNIDETYDLELQVFKFGEHYGDVKFFSVRKPRIEGSCFALQVAKDAAYDVFEGHAAVWGADAPSAFIVRVGRTAPDREWLTSLSTLFPRSICVVVMDGQENAQGPLQNYLTIRHAEHFLSSDPQASRFFALMATHDLVTSGKLSNLGNGQVRISGIHNPSVYGHSLFLDIDRVTYSKDGNAVTAVPSADRISQMADLKKTLQIWMTSESKTWQSFIARLQEYPSSLCSKAESFRSKHGSRLGTFTDIAETDQTELLASGDVEEKLLGVVLNSRSKLCQIDPPPLLVSGFRSGKHDCPNTYQQYLRHTQTQFLPGLREFLGAAERLVASVSRERRGRLRAHEKEEILALHSELSVGDRCDPDQLGNRIEGLRKSAAEIQDQIAEIQSEQDNEHLFSTDDVDVTAIHRDYLSSFRAAASLTSSYWLITVLFAIFGILSIPVIERISHHDESYFPYDMVYLFSLELVIAACFLFVAWRIQVGVKTRSALYAETLSAQFQRKDVAVCQFMRYLYLSTALRYINLIADALEHAQSSQNQSINHAKAIDGLVSHIVPGDALRYATLPLTPTEWVRYLHGSASVEQPNGSGNCRLTIQGDHSVAGIVEYSCRLLLATQTSIITGKLENAVSD